MLIPPVSTVHLSWSFPTGISPAGIGTSESWRWASQRAENRACAPTWHEYTSATLCTQFSQQNFTTFVHSFFLFFILLTQIINTEVRDKDLLVQVNHLKKLKNPKAYCCLTSL